MHPETPGGRRANAAVCAGSNGFSGGAAKCREEGSRRGGFAPSVLEHPLGLSGLDWLKRPINFTTTVGACFTPIFTINQGGRGGGRRNLLIRCRGPATASAVKHVFWLEQTSVNDLSRSSYGETPPMGGGVRPPGAGPEIGRWRPPLLILPCSWEGPPTAPIPPLFALRTPRFSICKTCKNLLLMSCRGPATRRPPPMGGGSIMSCRGPATGRHPP